MTKEQIKLELCELGRTIRKNVELLGKLERDDKHTEEVFWIHEESHRAHQRSQLLLNDLKFGRHE